jgi:hypothetical protein
MNGADQDEEPQWWKDYVQSHLDQHGPGSMTEDHARRVLRAEAALPVFDVRPIFDEHPEAEGMGRSLRPYKSQLYKSPSHLQDEYIAQMMNRMYGYGVNQSLDKMRKSKR